MGHLSNRKVRAFIGLDPLEPRVLLDAATGTEAAGLLELSRALFVENQGQWEDASIHYAFQGSGANVLFTDAGATFQVFRQEQSARRSTEFSVRFDGSEVVGPTGLERSQTEHNYFVGDPSSWRSGVPTYGVVAYEGLYDGVDLHAWGRRSGLKYEFHVAPRADYRQIRVRYEGVEGLWVDADGALHVQTALGELIDDAPLVYQDLAGGRKEVASSFVLIGEDT